MTTRQVIVWWEVRRFWFNAALLFIGLASVLCMELLAARVLPPGEDAMEPIALFLGIVLYASIANVVYTIGWIFELHERKTNPAKARVVAGLAFKVGTLCYCGLTTAPLWWGLLIWANRKL